MVDNNQLKSIIKKKPSPILIKQNVYSFLDEFILQYCKSLNCNNDFLFCDNCFNCQKLNNKNYFDFYEFNLDQNSISKEQTQIILNNLQYTSLENAMNKFFIIKNIDKANKFVLNLMLKSIENPIKNTFYIFSTKNIHLVLETIKSRCFFVNLHSDKNKVIKLLEKNNIQKKFHDFFLTSFFSYNEMIEFYYNSNFDSFINLATNLLEYKNHITLIKDILNEFKLLNSYQIEKLILFLCLKVDLNKKIQLVNLTKQLIINFNKILIFNQIINII